MPWSSVYALQLTLGLACLSHLDNSYAEAKLRTHILTKGLYGSGFIKREAFLENLFSNFLVHLLDVSTKLQCLKLLLRTSTVYLLSPLRRGLLLKKAAFEQMKHL